MNEFKEINQLIINSFDLLNISFEEDLLSLDELKIIENKLDIFQDLMKVLIEKKA